MLYSDAELKSQNRNLFAAKPKGSDICTQQKLKLLTPKRNPSFNISDATRTTSEFIIMIF